MEQKSYYAVIPASVRYDKSLSANAKLLYGEITALCNEQGYCWATNAYFANLYGVDKRSITRWVTDLQHAGYIVVDAENGDKRRITMTTGVDKNVVGYRQNCRGGIDKNVHHNNTMNNTMNKKENVKEKNEFVPPTLDEVKEYARSKHRLDIAEQFYEYFTTGDWVDAKGQKVRNWKQKFLTWCKFDGENGGSAHDFSTGRDYTKEEMNALFQSIDEIEI